MPKSLENRRRRSGFRNAPSRSVQQRIDHWRLADNKFPYENDLFGEVDEQFLGRGIRNELSTTWDDTKTMFFLNTGNCEETTVGPPAEVLPDTATFSLLQDDISSWTTISPAPPPINASTTWTITATLPLGSFDFLSVTEYANSRFGVFSLDKDSLIGWQTNFSGTPTNIVDRTRVFFENFDPNTGTFDVVIYEVVIADSFISPLQIGTGTLDVNTGNVVANFSLFNPFVPTAFFSFTLSSPSFVPPLGPGFESGSSPNRVNFRYFLYSDEAQLPVEGCSPWFGGWSLIDWSKDSNQNRVDRNRRLVLQNRRLVYDSSIPSADPTETEQEFADREFLFQPYVPLFQHWKASTGQIWSGDSFLELKTTAKSFWIDSTDDENVDSKTLELLRLTDSVLGPQRVKGDLPIKDVQNDRNIPWAEREFMSPYGFYDEILKKTDKAGIQLVASSGKGLESFGFAHPNVVNYHSNLNSSDFIRERQIPVRSRRGVGSDNFDWLPRSARHVWLLRPVQEFVQWETGSNDNNVFENWDSSFIRVASPVFPTAPPTSEQLRLLYAFEDYSDEYRSTRRAPQRLKNISDKVLVGRESFDFVRTQVWTQPYDPDEKAEPTLKTDRSASSILAGGGLFLGNVGPDVALGRTANVNDKVFASGDNFVVSKEQFDKERSLFSEDEWMIEVGFTTPFGNPDAIKTDFGPKPTFSGWFTERFLLSTSPLGGIPYDIASDLGAIGGEVRPRNGFAISVAVLPNFGQTTNFIESATVVSTLYLVQNDETKVARSFHGVPLDYIDGSFSARCIVSKKGNEFSTKLQFYGINEAFDSEVVEPEVNALFGLSTQIKTSLENFQVLDDVLVIPSIRSTRIFTQTFLIDTTTGEANFWTRTSSTESRILRKVVQPNPLDELLDCFKHNAFYNKPFGLILNGIAIHDVYVTDVNKLDAEVSRASGLAWSNWLGNSTRNNVLNFLDALNINSAELAPNQSVSTLNTPLSSFTSLINLRRRGSEFTGSFKEPGNERFRKLSEGVLVGQWKAGSLWNRPIDEKGVGFSGERLTRPWGFEQNRLLETIEDLKGDGNSRKHLTRVLDEDNLLISTLPTFSSWGTRFEARKSNDDVYADVKNDYLRNRVDLPVFNNEDAFFGKFYTSPERGRLRPSNYNVCLWLTVFDAEKGFIPPPPNSISAPTEIEKKQRIWEYGGIGKIELVANGDLLYLQSTTYNTDVSDTIDFGSCELRVQITPDMIGVPLHIAFGEISIDTPEAPENPSPGVAGRLDHKLGFLIVDNVDQDSFDLLGDPQRIANYFLPKPEDEPEGRFKFKLYPNKFPKQLQDLTGFVHMGQPEVDLQCDYVVGSVEMRQWMFDAVKTNGEFGTNDPTDYVTAIGNQEPFFDSFVVSQENNLVLAPRFPLLREWAFSRSQSLWGYTGRSRILPDHYGVSSIDGVGVDLFSDGKFNIAGGLEGDETEALNFIRAGFPNLFFSDKRLDYSNYRVAGYELTRSVDRPQLFEVFDRSLARNKFEKGDSDSENSLVFPVDDATDLSYIALNSDRDEEFENNIHRRESVQLLRRLWYGRGITSPIEPFPELSFGESEVWFAGERFYPIFTPALGQSAVVGIEDEKVKVQENLEKVVDYKGFGDLTDEYVSTDFDNVFVPLSNISVESVVYGGQVDSRKYGEIEFQRLRNLSYPWVKANGDNVVLSSLPLYRDLGNETKTSLQSPQEPAFYEIVRVGFWGPDEETTGNVVPIPQFPTYSLKFRNDVLSEVANVNYETNVLGNLCFERDVTVWGFAETPGDRLLPKFDTDDGSGLPTKYRIGTDDLGLVPDESQYEEQESDSFIDRRVWRRLKSGRQLLRTQRGRDRLERALTAFDGDSDGVFESFVTDVSPEDADKRFSKAFLGKGRGGWANAVWPVAVEDIDVTSTKGIYVDSLPPNPITFIREQGLERLVYERTNKVPDKTEFIQRAQEGWRHKNMQRTLREEISGSPSPINAGMDGLNPFPSIETVALNSMLFGSPRWTKYDKKLHKEFARTLQLALFPNGGFDDTLLSRAKNLWLELTGNQAFPAWLEWARPTGGWNTRAALDAMLPFFRYPFAVVGELDKVVSFNAASKVSAPATSRSEIDPNRVFERDLFENGNNSVLNEGELLLIDRLSTFDDEFPVTNLGYNFRFVRNIAGRLDPNLDKQIALDIRRVNPTSLQELGEDSNLVINGTDPIAPGTFVLNENSGVWTFSGTFAPGNYAGQQYKLFFNQNDIFATARAGVWLRNDEPGAPAPTNEELYISNESGGTRISKDPVEFTEVYEDNLWFAEAPIFFRFIGPDNQIEAIAYQNGVALGGTVVVLGSGIINVETGVFSVNFELFSPGSYTPPGILGFANEDIGVDEEIEVEGEIEIGGGDSIPFEDVDIKFYWFDAPSVVGARNNSLSDFDISVVLSIILWQEVGYEPEPYSVFETFVLESTTDALVVLGTVAPLALQNVLNRYRADSNVGYLRHSLASQRVSKTLLKLWFGTGDSLSREDYVHWWRGVDSFIVEQGNDEPTLSRLSDFDLFTRRDVIEQYNSESLEGGAFRPPNEGGNYSVWQKPVEQTRFVTSLRPFGPDVRIMNYQNKQHWTRDIKLQDRGRLHDVWSLRHAHPQEMMQDVTIKPRGWRYGLLDVTPQGGKWAINPRRWGQLADIVRVTPDGATLGINDNSVSSLVDVVIVSNDDTVQAQSRNKDRFYRSFDPFIETFEKTQGENLLSISLLKDLARTLTNIQSVEKAIITNDIAKENLIRLTEANEAMNENEIDAQFNETRKAFVQVVNDLSNVELPRINVLKTQFEDNRSKIVDRTNILLSSNNLDSLAIKILGSLVDESTKILKTLVDVENEVPKKPTLPEPISKQEALNNIQTRFFR